MSLQPTVNIKVPVWLTELKGIDATVMPLFLRNRERRGGDIDLCFELPKRVWHSETDCSTTCDRGCESCAAPFQHMGLPEDTTVLSTTATFRRATGSATPCDTKPGAVLGLHHVLLPALLRTSASVTCSISDSSSSSSSSKKQPPRSDRIPPSYVSVPAIMPRRECQEAAKIGEYTGRDIWPRWTIPLASYQFMYDSSI